jgi:hypothetical protein
VGFGGGGGGGGSVSSQSKKSSIFSQSPRRGRVIARNIARFMSPALAPLEDDPDEEEGLSAFSPTKAVVGESRSLFCFVLGCLNFITYN